MSRWTSTAGLPALAAIALAASCALLPGWTGARRPNLVLLLADDAGYADFGFQSISDPALDGLTPAIDALAADGARFTAFSTSGAVCSPSRAGLLTGRYQQRFGHEQNLPVGHPGGLPLAERTLADRLRAAGYATGLVGKWHLGYPPAFHPNERGFDHFHGLLQGSRGYHALEEPSAWRVLQVNGEPQPEQGYLTDRLGDAAVAFVRAHAHEPFFLFVSFTAPHGPLQPRPRDLSRPALARIEDGQRRRYAGLVKALDDNVGKILAALADEGLARDTLVVFTNDNGGQTRTGAVNTPLRGGKGDLWEGGVRVPCALRWPRVVRPGTVVDLPASALDLAPTFLAAAGVAVEELPAPALDGLDLAPLLAGGALPERTLFWRTRGPDGPVAARRGRWKLLQRSRDAAPALYDLVSDPGETTDVAVGHPLRVAELAAQLAAWEAALVEPAWGYP